MKFSGVLREGVRFSTSGNAAIITMNRPKAMNALNHPMVKLMRPKLKEWETSPIGLVLLKGEGGKAFCAGGDIKDLTLPTFDGDYESGTAFFREEYQLDYQIGTFPKPVVALIHGVVMGGGVGLSCHATFRVGTEKTLFAMPETSIGLFPDVGGGYFLPRISKPGLGLFLGLTGERMKGGNCQHANISTHTVNSASLPDLEKSLSGLPQNVSSDEVCSIIDNYQIPLEPFSLSEQSENIEKYFATPESLLSLVQDLEHASGDWEIKIAKKLRSMSPTSLAITFKQITDGRNMSLEEVFSMEYRLAYSCMRHEFPEGVRALLVDRDNNPQWKPRTIEDIPSSLIEDFFANKPNEWHPTN